MSKDTPRLIKRYSNRKMYDTLRSSYITLEEIAQLVKEGQEVKVVDNKTGEDLSSVTLAQIIFEEEKRDKGRMPLVMLKEMLLQTGETWSGIYRNRVEQVQEKAQLARQRAFDVGRELREGWESRIERFRARDELSGDEMEDEAALSQEERELRDQVRETHHVWDDIQHWLDEVIKESIRPMEYYKRLGAEFSALQERLASIEERLEELAAARLQGRDKAKKKSRAR